MNMGKSDRWIEKKKERKKERMKYKHFYHFSILAISQVLPVFSKGYRDVERQNCPGYTCMYL